MKILNAVTIRDGGTMLLTTTVGDFYLNRRITDKNTDKYNRFFDDYPDKESSNMLDESSEIVKQIREAMSDIALIEINKLR